MQRLRDLEVDAKNLPPPEAKKGAETGTLNAFHRGKIVWIDRNIYTARAAFMNISDEITQCIRIKPARPEIG